MNNPTRIEDCLHLYLGCDVEVDKSEYNGTKQVWKYIGTTLTENKQVTFINVHKTPVKPILRPLSDMTEEERNQLHEIISSIELNSFEDTLKRDAAVAKWLTSEPRFFDCFQLIEAGLAIDATTLQNKPTP